MSSIDRPSVVQSHSQQIAQAGFWSLEKGVNHPSRTHEYACLSIEFRIGCTKNYIRDLNAKMIGYIVFRIGSEKTRVNEETSDEKNVKLHDRRVYNQVRITLSEFSHAKRPTYDE